jgi:hypothetical protein
MPRHFVVCPDRTITLPQSLASGPGATNMQLLPGAVITLEDAVCTAHFKFVEGRKRAGDWKEVAKAELPKDGPEPVLVHGLNAQPAPGARPTITTGAPIAPKKEG